MNKNKLCPLLYRSEFNPSRASGKSSTQRTGPCASSSDLKRKDSNTLQSFNVRITLMDARLQPVVVEIVLWSGAYHWSPWQHSIIGVHGNIVSLESMAT